MEIEPRYLVGSCHRHANGYGYGTRVTTARNNPGVPSLPKYRISPEDSRIVTGSRSRPLNLQGDSADCRHAFQLTNQTSGDYGKFLYPVETRVSRPINTSRRPHTASETAALGAGSASSSFGAYRNTSSPASNQFSSSSSAAAAAAGAGTGTGTSTGNAAAAVVTRPQSESRGTRQMQITSSSSPSPSSSSKTNGFANTFSGTGSGTGTSFGNTSTMRSLDATIPGHCKYDLLAASVPARQNEVGWSIHTNIHGHQRSLDWRNGLRHSKK